MLTARQFTAAEAKDMGLVQRVVAVADLERTTREYCGMLAANAPLTVRAAREMIYLSTEMGRSAALRAGAHLFESVYRSEDAQEGPRAFREKRKPEWKGR